MKQCQITSDVANRLKKIRSGVVYSSITSVISELLQNCQRAKAENIGCQLKDGSLIITDDGTGCKTPEDLFTLDKSVWDTTTEGFGEGFTSVYTVADYLKVETLDWQVEMFIDKMINEGELKYITEDNSEYVKGFNIMIAGQKLKEHEDELLQFLKHSASLLPMSVFVNGKYIQKTNLANIDSETGMIKTFETKNYTAHLTPACWSSKIVTYYENREVCEEWVTGIAGNVILNKNAVNLKAPDRRSIVRDKKYTNFIESIKKDAKRLYKNFIQEADNTTIDRYAYPISQLLKVTEYEDLLHITEDMFKVHEEETKEDEKKLEILKPKYDIFYQDTERQENNINNISYFPSVNNSNEISIGMAKSLNSRARKTSISAISKSNKVFWIKASEISSFKESITNMEYYGFKGIIATNELYEKVFEHYKVPHISYLIDNIQKVHNYTDIGAKSLKERRVLYLMSMIERHYELKDTFNIANLSMKIVSNLDGKELQSPKTVVEGVCTDDKIYLDRKSLKLADFTVKTWNTQHIGVEDIRFILKNSDTICHELAHLLYHTEDNTLHHMQAQAKIAKEIGYLF